MKIRVRITGITQEGQVMIPDVAVVFVDATRKEMNEAIWGNQIFDLVPAEKQLGADDE